MKRFISLISVVAALIVALAVPVHAAALDNRVPSDALVYIGWAGSDALGPQYGQSNLKQLIEASAIREFVSKQLPALIEMASERDTNAPKQIAKLQTGLGIAWRHPVAFYFCPMDFTNPRRPTFRFGLMCDAGADAKQLADLLGEVLAQVPPSPELPVNLVQENNLLLLTFGKQETMADLKVGGTLSTAAAYIKAMAQVKQDGQAVAAFVDIQKLVAMVGDAMMKDPSVPAEVKGRIPGVIDALGLKGLTQMALLSGFDGKGWSDRAFVGISGPRTGILKLMDSAPLSDAILAAVPKDAAAFTASKFDLQRAITEARSVITKIDPQAIQEFDRALAMGSAELGVDIEKDIIAPLGDEWLLYRAPVMEGGLSVAFVTKLRDGEKFTKSLEALEKVFNEKSGAPIKVEKIKTGGTEVSSLMFLQYNVAWTVKNGYLYVSSISGISAAIDQVEKKAPSIVTSDLYKGVMAQLAKASGAAAKPTSIAYAHPARLYPELRTLVLGVLPLVRAQAHIDVPMDLLPDPTQVAEFMPPGGAITWSDAEGVHGVGTSSFPGAAILGGQQMGTGGVAVAAMGVAVLLPSLGKSRELANRSVDAANVRGLTQSCLIFANDNADAMPDHFGRLLLRGDISPKSLVSRRAGTPPLEMTPEMEKLGKEDFTKFAEAVDEHCDFVYIGKGTKSDTDASIVVAFEKPGPQSTDGINVAFQDAHAEFVRWMNVPEIFKPTNEYLAKKGLPVVDVGALMRKAPGNARGPGLP